MAFYQSIDLLCLLRSNMVHWKLTKQLDRLVTWERDSDVKARVRMQPASFKVNTENRQKPKCHKKEGSCHYCGKSGNWMKECRKSKRTLGRN